MNIANLLKQKSVIVNHDRFLCNISKNCYFNFPNLAVTFTVVLE